MFNFAFAFLSARRSGNLRGMDLSAQDRKKILLWSVRVLRRRADAYVAAAHKEAPTNSVDDRRYREVNEQDAKSLRAIADLIEEGSPQRAMASAVRLGTIVRDQIPYVTWLILGGGLSAQDEREAAIQRKVILER